MAVPLLRRAPEELRNERMALMRTPPTISSDIAFTDTVKAVQARKGSRRAYERMERAGGFATEITPELAAFVESRTSAFLATANAQGQPYVQHRGGPPGFLRVLDPRTLAFADFHGNKQFITTGNLLENPKAHLFLVDFEERERVKIWGEAEVIEDPTMVEALLPAGYGARADQVIVLHVLAWDANCPKHLGVRP